MSRQHDVFYNSVLNVNNMLHMEDQNINERALLTSDFGTYPKQRTEYIRKLIRIRYTDEREGAQFVHNRFWIDSVKYPTLLYKQLTRKFFLVLRWDTEFPRVVILMGRKGEIIVADADDLESLAFPPQYIEGIHEDFAGYPEIVYNTSEDNSKENIDTFYKNENKEHIYQYPIQNEDFLGINVFTEYDADITNTALTNQLQATKPKPYDTETHIDRRDKNKRLATIYGELREGDSPSWYLADYLLRGYYPFFNRHLHDKVDSPRKAINKGIILRADRDRLNGYIVVGEYSANSTMRFIVQKEASIYTDTEQIEKAEHLKRSKFIETIPKYKFKGEE